MERPRGGGSTPGPATRSVPVVIGTGRWGCEDSADDSGKTCCNGGPIADELPAPAEEDRVAYRPDGSRAGPSGRCVSLHWRAEARPVKITCPNCGSRARWPECPHCGYPLISRRREIASWCAFILAVTGIGVLMLRASLR